MVTYIELFNKKTIRRLCADIDISPKQEDAAKEWLELLEKNRLEDEKSNYPKFMQIILQDILGYSIKEINFESNNVEFQFANSDGKNILCFEVKGTSTKDLHAIQHRTKKEHETPIKQTWDYMGSIGLDYGICTNYKEFILITKELGYSQEHVFDFTSIKKNKDNLKEFIGIFSRKRIIEKGFVEKLYKKSISEEKEFTKEFYELFHGTRLMLIKNFEDNETVKVTKTEAIYYTQLFLNRLIFIYFVEDRGFIPNKQIFSDRIIRILESGQFTEHSRKVFEDIKELFIAFDKGSGVLGIFGFNGGLFRGSNIPEKIYFSDIQEPEFFSKVKKNSKNSKSPKLNEYQSNVVKKHPKLNPLISNLLNLDSFDFNTEVNVNILGHIFEQSISDIEELKKTETSRRKKEGVFYTPEYITNYICMNTIIPYLSKSNVNTITELIIEYEGNIGELDQKLKDTKILDPACGSGAFLIKAVDVLLEIHKEIQKLMSDKKSSSIEQSQITDEWDEEKQIRAIIENNIYGVDINSESVEITKLSLFLKLASGERKLEDLSKNIVAKNSLIDDESNEPGISNWHKMFPHIFHDPKLKQFEKELKLSEKFQDGFDIIVGNPPYIRIQTLQKDQVTYFNDHYVSPTKNYDIYILFLEKGLKLLKENGVLGFILPHKFFQGESGENIRNFISKNKALAKVVNFGTNQVFEDAITYTCMIFLSKRQNDEFLTKNFKLGENFKNLSSIEFDKKKSEILEEDQWNFSPEKIRKIIKKIKSTQNSFESITKKIFKGSSTGNDDIFLLDLIKKNTKTSIVFSDILNQEIEIENELLQPFVYGEDVRNYSISYKSKVLLFPYLPINDKVQLIPIEILKNKYPQSFNYLYQLKPKLLERKVKLNDDDFYRYSAARSISDYLQSKIMIPDMLVSKRISFDHDGTYFHGPAIHSVVFNDEIKTSPYFYLGILNSKLFWFFISNTSTALLGDAYRLTPEFVNPFCFPMTEKENQENSKELVGNVESVLKLKDEFIKKELLFWNRVSHKFLTKKITAKLENFFELSFSEFLNELVKNSSIQLKPIEEEEWEEYFEGRKIELESLHHEILEKEEIIDNIVFDLYSLTDTEREIILQDLDKNSEPKRVGV